MTDTTIKDFVKKQTTAITIGVPKARNAGESQPVQAPVPQVTQEYVAPKGHVGRPKSDITKVKISVYLPEEAKAKLVRIQHQNYKQNLNDVLLEAINDLIKKYGE